MLLKYPELIKECQQTYYFCLFLLKYQILLLISFLAYFQLKLRWHLNFPLWFFRSHPQVLLNKERKLIQAKSTRSFKESLGF